MRKMITFGVALCVAVACSTASAPTKPPPVRSAPAKPAAPAVRPAPPPAPTTPKPSAGSASETLQNYRAWITEARAKYPYADSEQRMYDVMMCESGGKASIVNKAGPYSGLFQYSKALWSGAWNSYRDQDVLDAKAQIFATALAWQKNMQGQWGCYKKTQ